MLTIQENVSLANYSAMRLGGTAWKLAEIHSIEEMLEAYEWAKQHSIRVLVIGSGANVIFRDDYCSRLVLINRIAGLDFQELENGDCLVRVGAGEEWDNVVAKTVERGLQGIETLSYIPGTAGAAPVQNIGAYGQQVASAIVEVEVYDSASGKKLVFSNKDCHFGYRSSRFNREDKGRFTVLSILLRLSEGSPQKPYYKDVEVYLAEHKIENPTVVDMREAVIAIRRRKLPDPKEVANCGSFFYNPVINQEQFSELLQQYPDLKAHQTDDGGLKLYAGQLIELAGFKGVIDEETGMGTWPSQALVVVNYKATSTQDLLTYKEKIVQKVHDMFGVTLEQEPELI